jgi:carbon monoxide dehydrogenase subunit G
MAGQAKPCGAAALDQNGLRGAQALKLSGTYLIDAPTQQVWEALNDIDVLARTIPGCERLEQVGANEYEGTLKIGIQAIKGSYNGRIRIIDIQPPTHYTIVASGRGANGVVDGTGTVDLSEQDGKTLLTYSGDAMVGGTLASVSQRLVEGATKQVINQSLKALAAQIAARIAPPDPPEAAPARASHNATVAPSDAPTAPGAETPPRGASTRAGDAGDAAVMPAHADGSAATPEPGQRRVVLVPEDERLEPSSVVGGMVGDYLRERPWMPWVIVAFLLGYIFGRRRD